MNVCERRTLKKLLAKHGLDALLEGTHAACCDLRDESDNPEDAERWREAVISTAMDGLYYDADGNEMAARIIPAAAC